LAGVLPRVLAQPHMQSGRLPQEMQMNTDHFAITLNDHNHAEIIDAMIGCFQNVL
jgi:hypothetical protein